jgi:hypothetical protein
MKKCQPLERSQHENKTTQTFINHTPELFKKPLNKLETYEMLRQELLELSPHLSEEELLKHCKALGKACGLRTYGGDYVD